MVSFIIDHRSFASDLFIISKIISFCFGFDFFDINSMNFLSDNSCELFSEVFGQINEIVSAKSPT